MVVGTSVAASRLRLRTAGFDRAAGLDRTASCRLQAASCKLQAASCRLQAAGAHRFMEARMASFSPWKASKEASPCLGGATMRPHAIWPRVLEQRPIETSLSS